MKKSLYYFPSIFCYLRHLLKHRFDILLTYFSKERENWFETLVLLMNNLRLIIPDLEYKVNAAASSKSLGTNSVTDISTWEVTYVSELQCGVFPFSLDTFSTSLQKVEVQTIVIDIECCGWLEGDEDAIALNLLGFCRLGERAFLYASGCKFGKRVYIFTIHYKRFCAV